MYAFFNILVLQKDYCLGMIDFVIKGENQNLVSPRLWQQKNNYEDALLQHY